MLKRIAKAFLAFSFGQVIGFASNILLVPLFLHVWSPAKYGEWLTLYSAVAYLTTLDMGVQLYVINRLTQAYARGDLEDYRAVQHTAFAFYSALAAIAGLAVTAVAAFAPLRQWFSLTLTNQRVVVVVIALLAFQYLSQLPGSIVFSAYRTTGNLALSQWVANLKNAVTLGFTILALIFMPSFVAVASAQLAVYFFVLVFILWDVRRRYPQLMPSFSHARWDLLGGIVKPSMWFGGILFSTMLVLQGSNLLVAGALGAAAVAVFVTTRTLANSIRQIVNLFTNASWTDLTRLEAVDDRRRLSMAFRLLVFSTTAGCIAISASLWFEGTSVISFWTQGKLTPDPQLLHWFLLYLVLQTPWVTASIIPCVSNRHRVTAIAYLASSITGLSVAALMVHHIGVVALPAGLMIGEFLACYHFVIRDSCRVSGERYGRFASRLWVGMSGVCAVALLSTFAVHGMPFPMLVRWIASGAASTIAVLISSWLFWLRSEDRTFVCEKAAGAIRGFRRRLPVTARGTAPNL